MYILLVNKNTTVNTFHIQVVLSSWNKGTSRSDVNTSINVKGRGPHIALKLKPQVELRSFLISSNFFIYVTIV